MSGLPFYLGAVVAGLLFGWLFVLLWRWCAPRDTNRRFWAALAEISRQMLAVDEPAALLRLYGRLGRDVGGYVLRNLGGLVLACAPVGVFLLLAGSPVLTLWDRGAEGVAFYPSRQAWESVAPADLRLDDATPESVGRTAICWSAGRCLLFELLAFRVVEQPAPAQMEAAYVVARAGRGDGNFLWPYLNDLEFVFLCALMVGSFGTLFRRRSAARSELRYDKA